MQTNMVADHRYLEPHGHMAKIMIAQAFQRRMEMMRLIVLLNGGDNFRRRILKQKKDTAGRERE